MTYQLTDGPSVFAVYSREQIAALADHLVPALGDKPSASDAGVHTRYIDRALAARPDLVDPLTRVLAVVDEHGLEAGLSALPDEELAPVVNLIVACYYMSPKARRSIDYRGQVPTPIAEGEAEYYLEEDDILAPVLALGPRWRTAPGDPSPDGAH